MDFGIHEGQGAIPQEDKEGLYFFSQKYQEKKGSIKKKKNYSIQTHRNQLTTYNVLHILLFQ
jgi:hypothetical protein